MAQRRKKSLQRLLRSIQRFLKKPLQPPPDSPDDDPFAYVGAPKKPRPPYRAASAAQELE